GEWLRVEIRLPGYSVWLRTWQVQVGTTRLLLLDSNDPANFPTRRGITSELYGGNLELRLNQEMVLGLGGWRLLEALGIHPEVCHLNEGHAAFAVLERAHSFMEQSGQPFEVALAVTRAGNLFTTHTPVEAGFDRFPPDLVEQYLGWYARNKLGITLHDLLALGRRNPDDSSETFNMAYLALRGSGAANGVSRLHGAVSRRIFQSLFPRWPENEVPVGYITNGVHMSSWDSEEADALWTESCGKERWMGDLETLEKDMLAVPDSRLWECRASARQSLVEYVRERFSLQLEACGSSPGEVAAAARIFDFNTLTLGFARRFATYKRPNLLLTDPERLARMLTNTTHPVQLIIAGKAHPEDRIGQKLILEWTRFARRPEVHSLVVFLSDYDMFLTGQLVQGVDLWINTPRRPWEACGTSGMKVLVNGGLNLSELDGWWDEAYTPDVGWAIGDRSEHGTDESWDAVEADALYSLLENDIIPEFYRRDRNGVPPGWIRRIRESMARLTPRFSANRTVREYTEKYYIPAAQTYLIRAAQKGSIGERIVRRNQDLKQRWHDVRFGEIKVQTVNNRYMFEIPVYLGGIDPDSVTVELYAEGVAGSDSFKQEMDRGHSLTGTHNGYIYFAETDASRPSSDFTARIICSRAEMAIPLEAEQILWQK
ncbi:MAG TPA: alpha-glucan family phosphorylase, partial [Syntrophorhabdaceae bacterium]|nr:alpha-glucan family phosphorylase [Syntrophorhabdaceae bacterium]